MARFGFVGPSYTSQSVNAACQRCVNWYVEAIEVPNENQPAVLYPRPGKTVFCTLSGSKVRGIFRTKTGRTFAVSGTELVELFSNGTTIVRGTGLVNDGLPATFAASILHLLVTSGGSAYVLTLATNAFAAQSINGEVISQVAYIDGFFLALVAASQKFYISAVLNALSWPALQVIQVSVFPDNVLAMIASHRELWLFGETRSVVYYDAGTAQIFEMIPNSLIEQGTGAMWSPVNLDNTILWFGADERGTGIAWRADGYTPRRVSNHAVENEWQSYGTISDVISYTEQRDGHSFWMLYFPTANKTWVYDVATNLWHERSYLNTGNGQIEADLAQCHVFAFGKHLLGDRQSGNVYESAADAYDDAGSPIRWVRRAPHISDEQRWTFFYKLQVLLESGLGPQPPLLDGNGNPRDPELNLRWSDDGGHTWSNEYPVGVGQAGNFRKRAMWLRLGRSRDRVFELNCSDPIPWRIVDAFIETAPGTGT